MTPERPNCVVDITDVVEIKERALAELGSQHAFSAQMMRRRLSPTELTRLVGLDAGAGDDAIGYSLHRQTDRALHLYHGVMSHSAQAVLAEPYRREGVFTLPYLVR